MNNLNFINLSKASLCESEEILIGLKDKKQKKINSKFFYDREGSKLFDKITKLNEYYPTRKELEILENKKEFFKNLLPEKASIIEFGSGSNIKIKKLLEAMKSPKHYIPIDISHEFLLFNAENIAKNFPYMSVKAVCADYGQINLLKEIINQNENIVGFFPGSTIGNYNPEEAKLLLINFSKIIGSKNFLIIGVDLRKEKDVMEKAYNDSEGITAKFNKNILNGVNRICGTIFDSQLFTHKAFFNEKKSRIEMHLVSNKKQIVEILNTKIFFREGETIHTENSYKYTVSSFQNLAELSNFEIIDVLKDKKSFFGVFIMKVKSI